MEKDLTTVRGGVRMEKCDWNFIFAIVGALGGIIGIYAFLKGGIEKMIQRQTDTLHKDIMGIKDDIKEMREDSRKMNERIDRSYQMFVDLLKGDSKQDPRTNP